METVTIPKTEYEKLKKKLKVDMELVNKIKNGLEDIKQGRIKKYDYSQN
ncbi:hypothetical protein J4216_06335 [Candidatus Woesearchaeota archaeon]|nr:hypothetical protein [Candidatus Woesearchaeota archaeon]